MSDEQKALEMAREIVEYDDFTNEPVRILARAGTRLMRDFTIRLPGVAYDGPVQTLRP